jgi:hypothetical protein
MAANLLNHGLKSDFSVQIIEDDSTEEEDWASIGRSYSINLYRCSFNNLT